MNLGGKQPMSFDSSSASRKSADGVPRHFPAGLRVLVVDDDHTCLKILEKMLVNCHYKVTKCSRAEDALKLLRDQRDGYDIVLSDVHMPDMDGFNLLEHVGLEMELPVIMMSADDSKDVVMKGVTHGACDYLIKPISMEALKNIWQHVVRRKKQVSKEHSGSEDGDRAQRQSEDVDYTSSATEAHWKGGGSKKRKEDETEDEERDDSSTLKKPRVVWTSELHIQFVNAVNQLGIDKAVPKKILELMNVPGLTRENVASHLQKYRIYLRKLSVPQRNGITSALDSPFGLFDFHQQFATGQLSSQGAAGILNPPLNRVSNRSGMDQRTIFSSDTPTIGFLPQNDCSNKLLHGIPTNMDSKQLGAALHLPPEQPFNSMNMSMLIPSHSSKQSSLPQMVQPQLRTLSHPHPHLLSEANILNPLPSGISSAATAAVQGGFRNVHLQNLGVSVSQPLAFARNQGSDLAGSSRLCSVGNNSWRNMDPSSNATNRIEEMKSELVLSRGGFVANYDALNGRGEELEHQAAAVDPTCTGDSSSRNKYAEGGMIHDIHNYFFNDQCEEADVISRILGQQSESSILGVEHDCRSLDGLIFPCGKQQELN